MSISSFKPPKELEVTGNLSSNWKRFKDEFEIFLVAAGLDDKPARRKAMCFLNVVGPAGRDIYNTFTFEAGHEHRLTEIYRKFHDHCNPVNTETVDRLALKGRVQQQGESITQYVTALRTLADKCNFGDLKDSMIRDQIMFGVLDSELQDDLFKEQDLTLEKCLNLCNASEVRGLRNKERLALSSQQVHGINKQQHKPRVGQNWHAGSGRGQREARPVNHSQSYSHTHRYQQPCKWCGKKHGPGKCPAYGKKCNKCQKMNHFASVCRSSTYRKKVHTIESQDEGDSDNDYVPNSQSQAYASCGNDRMQVPPDLAQSQPTYDHAEYTAMFDYDVDQSMTENQDDYGVYIDMLNNQTVERQNHKEWRVTIPIESKKVEFKIDSGSEINTLPLQVYNKITNKPLQSSKAKLIGYFGQTQKPVGKAVLLAQYKGKYFPVEFEILQSAVIPVLGLDTSIQLKLIKRLDGIKSVPPKTQPAQTPPTAPPVVKSTVQAPEKHTSEATNTILDQYECLFNHLGDVEQVYQMKITPEGQKMSVIHPPRRVPLPLKGKLKKTLNMLQGMTVIARVTEATSWVNSLVILEKKDGTLRLCLDPTDLNKVIMREHYPMKTVEEVSANLAGSEEFSVLDADKAFYQVRMHSDSTKYLVFNTPFGRYKFLRMPFGICSAPEVWQRVATEIFEGLEGVEVMMDDILVHGKNKAEHDKRLKQVLERCKERNLTLNKKKCKIGLSAVRYMGHVLSKNGVEVDPKKVEAVVNYPTPEDKESLSRLLGIVTYVGKFIPNMSEKTNVLWDLVKGSSVWNWFSAHDEAMTEVKNALISAPVLKYYEVDKPVLMTVDASSKGLGGCLIQDERPVAFSSRSLTETEKGYAQIEKEMLAIQWGCSRFHDYIYGHKDVTVETDHKPLEVLFKKPIALAPPRIQRLMLKTQKYQIKVVWKPGKSMIWADALSRAYIPSTNEDIADEEEEYEVHVLQNLPISDSRMVQFREETEKDGELQLLKRYAMMGWPSMKSQCAPEVTPYWCCREEISVCDGLLLKSERLIVPRSMRKEMLAKIHQAHMGIDKTLRRAKDMFYWPSMNAQVKEAVEACSSCALYRPSQQKEPMLGHTIPERPWQKVASDLFEDEGKDYILLADYYSKFVEYTELQDTSSAAVIKWIKEQCARHGIFEEIITDNGPQYASKLFKQFGEDYGFSHVTSSPTYPQSNGFAESQVKIIKSIMKKARDSKTDIDLAILEWRNTPIQDLGSPVQVLMGRRTRSTLPCTQAQLKPKPVTVNLYDVLEGKQARQKEWYDKTARMPYTELGKGEEVRMKTDRGWMPATVVTKCDQPRSYNVERNGRVYRRNRRDLMETHDTQVMDHQASHAVLPPVSQITPVVPPVSQFTPVVPPGQQMAPPSPPPPVVQRPVTDVSKTAKPIVSPTTPIPVAKPVVTSRVSGRTIKTPGKFKDFVMG